MLVEAGVLLDLLRQEKEVFCELLDLSNIEQEYIIQNDIEGLFDVTGKKERLAVTVQELEQKRKTLLGSSEENRPFASLRSHMSTDGIDPLLAKEADELRDELISVLTEFDNINQTNGELLKRNLDYVGFMLNAIMPDENPMYTNTAVSSNVGPRLFDGKA
jgi:flagellar biosynthesis/type III secretory pathway chaperone